MNLHVEMTRMLPRVPPATAEPLHRFFLQESGDDGSMLVLCVISCREPFQGLRSFVRWLSNQKALPVDEVAHTLKRLRDTRAYKVTVRNTSFPGKKRKQRMNCI